MRRRVKFAPDVRNRRGATMVLVAMFMVVLAGFVGVSVDFARMYAFKAQLQTVADAGAMAGVIELARKRPTQASNLAIDYGTRNKVEGGNSPIVNAADVLPGTWDFAAGTFTPLGSWSDPGVNAVKVTARYSAGYTFGKVFGVTTQALSAVGTAALGSAGASSCMKPWAVPYQNLLWASGYANPNDLAHDLTEAEVAVLRDQQKSITFKTDPNGASATDIYGAPIPGNYYAVRYPQDIGYDGTPEPNGKPVGGASTYESLIGSAACLPWPIRVGDWLQSETGNMVTPTARGTRCMCGDCKNGGIPGGGEKWFACTANQDITLPIWANQQPKGGGTVDVQVKYIGAFHVTDWSNTGSVRGYLTSLSGGSGFVAKPGPVVKGALVD